MIADHHEAQAHQKGFLSCLAFQSSPARFGNYRADVDGLRAVAILAVVFFHAKVLWCAGGYVGVDVFFVISGYLITSLIVKDLSGNKFSFVSFYERRIRRIFPALFGVLFFSALAGFVLFVPTDLAAFGKDLIATTLFVSNIYFWRTAQPLGYFSHNSTVQVLIHTWSLSVEEQFYLVFPGVLVLLFRTAGRWTNLCLFFLASSSFGLNIWATHHRPVAAFYLSLPRAWELLIGALLATRSIPTLRSRAAREIEGVLGLTLIIIAVNALSEVTPFPGYAALLPCLGTALIIYSGEDGASTTKTLLSFQPLVFIGIISYSLYLWHWPLLVFSRYFVSGDLTGVETAAVLACSAMAAFVSFRYIERPFRGASSRIRRNRIFALGLAASLAVVVVGFLSYRTQGLPDRYGAGTRRLIAANIGRESDYDVSCANWRTQVHKLADIKFCDFGGEAPKKIMFWGDSHIEQLIPAVKAIYSDKDLKGEDALFAIANGCLPSEHLDTIGGYQCDSFSKFAMMRAEEKDIDTVFIGFNTWWANHDDAVCDSVDSRCTKVLSPGEAERQFLSELADHIRELRSLGKRVIICLPFPMYDKEIPELEMHNAIFARFGLSEKASDYTSPALRDTIRSAATGAGAEIFDPRASLCPQQNCITESNDVSIHIDNEHLAASQVGILKSNLLQVLEYDSSKGQPRRARG